VPQALDPSLKAGASFARRERLGMMILRRLPEACLPHLPAGRRGQGWGMTRRGRSSILFEHQL
jgi:hypothetical protein